MSESRLKHVEDEEYSSRIVEHSLTADPLSTLIIRAENHRRERRVIN